MKTAVVILNRNTREYLERWLPGLVSSCRDAEVIVADNASDDGSLEMLAAEFPDIRTISLNDNYGFTGGYNRALARVNAEYYVLINSDVRVNDGWLEPLVDWMDNHEECGICGPKLHRLMPDGTCSDSFEYAGAAGGLIDRFGYPYCRGRVPGRTEKDYGQYDKPREVMWVSGACLMTRSSLWERLGGLEEGFFAHMEEIDYCWRAQLAGYRVNVVPQSTVWHLGGGTLSRSSAFKLKLNYRNNLLLLDRNLPATTGPSIAARRIRIRKFLDLCSATVYLLCGRTSYFKAVLEAHREFKTISTGSRQTAAAGGRMRGTVYGYTDICIILQTIIRRKRIFEYLRKYEDYHRRCR